MKHLTADFRYSFSKLAGYIQCPRSFYLNYVVKDSEGVGNFFGEVGSWCHSLLESWAKDEIPAFLLAEEFEAGYDEHVKMAPPPFPKNLGATSHDQCLAYFENFDGFGDEWEVISVEDKFILAYEGYNISGIADLVLRHKETGAIRIIDHKTKSAASMAKEINLYRKQLYLYCHWCKQRFGQWPQDVCFNMIKTQEMIIEPFSEEEYNKSMQWYLDVIHQIEASDALEDWPCNINKFFCGNLCDMCSECTDWLEIKQADYQAWLAKKQAEEEMYGAF